MRHEPSATAAPTGLAPSWLAHALWLAIGLTWLAVAWLWINGFPVGCGALACAAALALTASLLGNLVLDRRARQAHRAESAIRQLYSIVSQALEAVPVGVQIKDADLRYVWVSRQHGIRTGYQAAEMLGRRVEEVDMDAGLAAAVTAHDRRVLESGQAQGPEEQVIQARDGRLKYISLVTKIPLLTDGKVSHIVSISADLTTWREAQVRAEEVRRLLESVLDAAPITIHVTDRDGRLRWANRALCEQIGWTDGSPVGKSWEELSRQLGPAHGGWIQEDSLLDGTCKLLHVERRFPATATLPERSLLIIKVPLYDAAGEVDQVLSMGTDLAALAQARAEADTANRLVESILRHVPLSIQVKDADLRYRWVNDQFCQLARRDAASLLGARIDDLDIPAETKASLTALDRSVLDSGETLRFERTWKKNGAVHQGMIIKAPIPDAAGRPAHVITIGADISELYQLRVEVDETRRRLQTVLDAVPVTLALKDTERRHVWVNRAFARVHGHLADDIKGKRIEDVLDNKALTDAVAAADRAVLATGREAPPMVQRHADSDGRVIDFDVKSLPVPGVDGRVDGILAVGMDVTELRRLNEELEQRAAERAVELAKVSGFMTTIIERSPLPILTHQTDGRLRSWNPAAERLTGISEAEALRGTLQDLFPEERALIEERLRQIAAGQSYSNLETRRKRRDGKVIEILSSGAPLARDDGTIDGGVGIWLDITEQRAAERQLRQAQKMEAIGQLTGNVAHDFNNLLAVVIGNLDLLLDDLPAGADSREVVGDAIAAAEKGAALTGRLLAFARQQTLRPVTICVATLVAGMRTLLQRAIGETIVLAYSVDADPWLARIDASQLESAILNLSVNARDAMPDGGKLTIGTHNAVLEADPHAGVAAGDYVCVSVADTGAGIAPTVLAQVFEPFFTTKEPGKGSGLGLSIVYGFVKQSGGHIQIHSEPGSGTCVRLYLPRALGSVLAAPADDSIVQGRGETILLVEDNAQLRRTSASTIQALGYRVITAGDAETALAMIGAHPEIALLFSDIVLPGGVNGFALADTARRQRPELPVLFVSGFVDPSLRFDETAGHGTEILTKPFRRAELAARLQAALGQLAGAVPDAPPGAE